MNKWPSVSPSRAADLVCPKKYYNLHVLKKGVKHDFSPACVYGSLLHSALKEIFDPSLPQLPNERNIEGIVRQQFSRQPYPDPQRGADDMARCMEAVKSYVSEDRDGCATTHVEVFDDFTMREFGKPPLRFGVRYDRLIVRPEEPDHLIIRDYKTGQLTGGDPYGACIMLLVAKAKWTQYKTVTLEYDYLGAEGLALRIPFSFGDAKAVWPAIKESAYNIYGASEFPAQRGSQCDYCPFRDECYVPVELTTQDVDALFS